VEAVAATTDGFALAEVDLELRGEGDVLGDAQSGARSSRLLRVVADADLIATARAAAERSPRIRRSQPSRLVDALRAGSGRGARGPRQELTTRRRTGPD
jgi:RecG-like helicase